MGDTVSQMSEAIARLFAKKGTSAPTTSTTTTNTTPRKIDTEKLFPAVKDMFGDTVDQMNYDREPSNAKKDDGTYTSPDKEIVTERDDKGDLDPLGELFNEETERVKREQEAALLKQKLGIRDSMLAERLGYEESAIDYINSTIAQERSNANLFGIDYQMDDDIKQSRINEYFATMWTEQQEKELTGMLGEFGNPEGFSGFTAQRGQGNYYANRGQASRTQVNRSRGIKTPEDFENILTGYMPLGGVDSILGA